jgi:aminoglycoside phosphotransferase (APT) family kinase protein
MRDLATMPQRIGRWLESIGHPGRVCSYQLMTGGYSRDMARLTVEWTDGDDPVETLVMRGDPPDELATLQSDRDMEWAVLRALAGVDSLAVPKARFYCDDAEVFGTKAIFMEFVDGGSLQAALDAGLDLESTADQFVDTVAAVASIEPRQVPCLPCPESWDEHIEAVLGRWHALARVHPEAQPITRYLAAWLRKRRPKPLPLRLQHADLQAGNIVVGPLGWRIVDWEFARIGDPREDLGYYNAYSGAVPPNLADLDLNRFLARFRERTGFDEDAVNPITFGYFTVLSTVTAVEGLIGASAAMAHGSKRGIPIAFNTHLVSIGSRNFLGAVLGMEAMIDELEAAR